MFNFKVHIYVCMYVCMNVYANFAIIILRKLKIYDCPKNFNDTSLKFLIATVFFNNFQCLYNFVSNIPYLETFEFIYRFCRIFRLKHKFITNFKIVN